MEKKLFKRQRYMLWLLLGIVLIILIGTTHASLNTHLLVEDLHQQPLSRYVIYFLLGLDRKSVV